MRNTSTMGLTSPGMSQMNDCTRRSTLDTSRGATCSMHTLNYTLWPVPLFQPLAIRTKPRICRKVHPVAQRTPDRDCRQYGSSWTYISIRTTFPPSRASTVSMRHLHATARPRLTRPTLASTFALPFWRPDCPSKSLVGFGGIEIRVGSDLGLKRIRRWICRS